MIPWRDLPAPLAALRDLALDLRWTWSHEADALWARVDNVLWQRNAKSMDHPGRRLGRQVWPNSPRTPASSRISIGSSRRGAPTWPTASWFAAARGGRAAGRRRLVQHGVRSRRGAAAVRWRAWRAGGRFPEGGERPRRAGHRDRPVVPGGLLPPDDRRQGTAVRGLSVQRSVEHADRARARRRAAAGCAFRSNCLDGRCNCGCGVSSSGGPCFICWTATTR